MQPSSEGGYSEGKDLPEEEYSRLAEQILEICKRYQVPCILHTYVNVAEKLHHPYIHLPIFLLENMRESLEVSGRSEVRSTP